MYANEPAAAPWPAEIFKKGKAANALTGFAHFHGSMPHSTLLMDLALGNLDFLEVFQFGKLWTAEWYELLNAGLRVTGIAGSDFPVHLGRTTPWPKHIPILGPERTLVKAQAGQSAYTAWAAPIKKGEVTISNGPLVEIAHVNGAIRAEASFYQNIESFDLIRNGKVVGTANNAKTLKLETKAEPGWYAAHAKLKKAEGEIQVQGHTNPLYVGTPGIPDPPFAPRSPPVGKRNSSTTSPPICHSRPKPNAANSSKWAKKQANAWPRGNVRVFMVQDAVFTLRSLRRQPGFFAVAVCTLALGVASTTAVFSLFYQVLLRTFPSPNRSNSSPSTPTASIFPAASARTTTRPSTPTLCTRASATARRTGKALPPGPALEANWLSTAPPNAFALRSSPATSSTRSN